MFSNEDISRNMGGEGRIWAKHELRGAMSCLVKTGRRVSSNEELWIGLVWYGFGFGLVWFGVEGKIWGNMNSKAVVNKVARRVLFFGEELCFRTSSTGEYKNIGEYRSVK